MVEIFEKEVGLHSKIVSPRKAMEDIDGKTYINPYERKEVITQMESLNM